MIVIIFISLYFKVGFNLSDFSNIAQNITKLKDIKTYKTPQLAKQEKTNSYKTSSLNPQEKTNPYKNTQTTKQENNYETENNSILESKNEIKEEYNPQEDYYNNIEEELEELDFEDINNILNEYKSEETEPKKEYSSDLVDKILKRNRNE